MGWVALVDGNKTQIRILRKLARKRRIKLHLIVDVIHVSQYLWSAGLAFNPEGSPELETWVSHRFLEVLRGHASNVAAGLGRSAKGDLPHCQQDIVVGFVRCDPAHRRCHDAVSRPKVIHLPLD